MSLIILVYLLVMGIAEGVKSDRPWQRDGKNFKHGDSDRRLVG